MPLAAPHTAPRRRPLLGEQPSRTERVITAALLLWLLAGPRIELGLQGLRVEDVVLGALALLCLLHARPLRRPSGVTIALVIVVGMSLVSAAVASARGLVGPTTSVLFALRPLEYWIAFPAALLLARSAGATWRRPFEVVLVVTTLLQTAFAALQFYLQLPIGFSHAAYTRAAGLTVGPYELGAISAALLVYWASRGRWVLAAVAVVGLATSISRISILGGAAALGLLALVHAVRALRRARAGGVRSLIPERGRPRLRLGGQLLSMGASVLVLAFTLGFISLPASPAPEQPSPGGAVAAAPADDDPGADEEVAPSTDAASSTDDSAGPAGSIAERLSTTSVQGSWAVSAVLAEAAPRARTSVEYADTAYSHMNDYVNAAGAAAQGAEASNLVRFFRWHLILRTIDDPGKVLLGLGPSFTGPSVDGSYLRMFADGGVLGLIAWAALIVLWLRRRPLWSVCVTATFLIGAVFIDILYAERPMVLFWMLLGLAAAERARAASGPTAGRRADDSAPTSRSEADRLQPVTAG